ncbi:hypothetical protein DICPUDRAFT_52467 [Dictyostelium purpureum]|uniref:Lysosomal dipeptide transporter MFSD1 n=1 Tax=Dictyostelium purpureum TaxID=5786 RepID=F0Z8F5_DICPU|nr:uncharacterized protein DICPUDRAFT_52467 [Dictyostelium purpureum]EGC39714.1 hypothetical protein DICPUDRAFT_52467 [Dictyostelium purpureum]|eukprot:XP_003283700.1 hypothetical protein DICPUDRAFT_52467 [Dictyostelium purpureum]
MDYIDLDASNNILRKSLRNLQYENPLARKKSNRFKEFFSMKLLKTIFLVFMISNLGYSSFFSYTSPEALSHTFYNVYSLSSRQFSSLFTLYAVPNIVMVFLSGIVVDILGPDRVSIVLSAFVVLSTLIGALSPPNYGIMLFSRFLLGFAGESLIACSNTMMSKWFSSKTLSLGMGVLVGWIYSANFISLVALPAINKAYGFNVCLWVIFFVSVFGIVLNAVYLVLKKRFSDKINQQLHLQQQQKYNNQYDEDSGIILITDLNNDLESIGNINSNYKGLHSFKLKFRESTRKVVSIFKEIPIRMWIIVGIVFFGYTALFGLAIIGPDFLNQKYGYNEQKAALILSSEHVCSALFSPICGVFIKKVSKRIAVLLLSLILFGVGLTLLLVTNVFPLPWIIICGIGYSILNTTIISSLPLFVPDSVIGTCYGFVGTAYNCGLVVFPVLLGALKESTGNYNLSVGVLIANSFIAALLVGLLKYFDLKSKPNERLDKL